MLDKEFNLLEEPWIRVMDTEGKTEEVSLTEALLHAQDYYRLAGELPTQDAAMLRFLLAVLHAVFGRRNIAGEEEELEDEEQALDRWEELWQNSRFPEAPLRQYLEEQRERFWLFHPTRPFWQVPSAQNATPYGSMKLNGSISESNNKSRLFAERFGEAKDYLTYAEAARWLLHINAFNDNAYKESKKEETASTENSPSLGVGWVGKIGFVCLEGQNLFETLMFNLVFLDHKRQPWKSCTPTWEAEAPRSGARIEIVCPHDQAALLSLQSRRLLLERKSYPAKIKQKTILIPGKDGYVNGIYIVGGDFFDEVNAYSEQMTVWTPVKKGSTQYKPKQHEKARKMWRDSSLYLPCEKNEQVPGVVRWNQFLQENRILPHEQQASLSIASIEYGGGETCSYFNDIFSDSLKIHLNLLSEIGEAYCDTIKIMIDNCDTIAGYLGEFAINILLASGGSFNNSKKNSKKNSNNPGKRAKEQYYYAIDLPFRSWLSELDATDDRETRDNRIEEWSEQARRIAYKQAREMVDQAGLPAYIGRSVSGTYYSSSRAMERFRFKMNKLQRK